MCGKSDPSSSLVVFIAKVEQGRGSRDKCIWSVLDHLRNIPVQLPDRTKTTVRLFKKWGLSFRKSVVRTEESGFENHCPCGLMLVYTQPVGSALVWEVSCSVINGHKLELMVILEHQSSRMDGSHLSGAAFWSLQGASPGKCWVWSQMVRFKAFGCDQMNYNDKKQCKECFTCILTYSVSMLIRREGFGGTLQMGKFRNTGITVPWAMPSGI